jgi:tricorn protease
VHNCPEPGIVTEGLPSNAFQRVHEFAAAASPTGAPSRTTTGSTTGSRSLSRAAPREAYAVSAEGWRWPGQAVWMLESLDAKPVHLDIRLSGVRSGRASYPVSAKSQLGSFTLDSIGRVLAAEVRGTVHWVPGRDGPARALLAKPGLRGRLPVVIPGTDAVACTSDNGGEDGLDVIPADGSAARRIGHGEFGRILELAVAPDGRTPAVACADGRLLTVALAGEPVITEIARSTIEEVAGLAFSPDSALLAWSQPWLPEPRA